MLVRIPQAHLSAPSRVSSFAFKCQTKFTNLRKGCQGFTDRAMIQTDAAYSACPLQVHQIDLSIFLPKTRGQVVCIIEFADLVIIHFFLKSAPGIAIKKLSPLSSEVFFRGFGRKLNCIALFLETCLDNFKYRFLVDMRDASDIHHRI